MFILLFLLWLVLNGSITWEIVLVGLVVCAAVTLACTRLLGIDRKNELLFLKAVPWFLAWFFVLLGEIVKANFAMIRIILDRSIAVRQALVTMDSGLHSDIALAMLSNSITLTPGTITVEVGEGGVLTVHCISWEMLEGIRDGRLMRIIRKVEALYGQGV